MNYYSALIWDVLSEVAAVEMTFCGLQQFEAGDDSKSLKSTFEPLRRKMYGFMLLFCYE